MIREAIYSFNFLTLGFFAMVVVIIWIRYKLSVRNREMTNKERMALIEKGVYDFPKEYIEKPGINLHKYLFWGFVLLGAGVGLITDTIIRMIRFGTYQGAYDSRFFSSGITFIFTGLAILLFYKIQSNKEKEKKEKISTNSKVEKISE
jgi:hypothetical protein